MKWHDMYGRHEVVWTIKKTGERVPVDLFRLGHILHITAGVRDQTKVCHAVSRVCEITAEWQADVFYRYLGVVNSVRGQGKSQVVMELCRQKVTEEREKTEPKRDSISQCDRQLELSFD
jgi:hypothetical protein